MKKETSTKELAEILVNAIADEPYFNKDILIPKVRAIISGFRLKLAASNYNKIENPTETARLIRAIELHNLEKEFWRQELKQIVGDENMKKYYDKRDQKRLLWNGTNESQLTEGGDLKTELIK